ncbi:MAG: hypothetical protein LBQ35_02745 [Spirochaetaceae bacterium]|jgi:tetratricopeptide (TPR) repeat protein|nr:hypothetical protein [Spirochaetaceae bacterium]
MIQLLFSLRYQTQIRRTMPELYESLERSMTAAIEASGGVHRLEHRSLVASFDETAIGFWLDMLTLLESIHGSLEDAGPELFGYICLLAPDLEQFGVPLSRALPTGGTGIWCSSLVRRGLAAYADFEPPAALKLPIPQAADFARLGNFKAAPGAEDDAGSRFFPYREQIMRLLRQNGTRSALIRGPRFAGKRDGIRRYCRDCAGDFPPLVITFGAGGEGLCCITDALTQEIAEALSPLGEEGRLEELKALAGLVSRERLQEQYPSHTVQETRRFLRLLLEAYTEAARRRQARPFLILENLNAAEGAAAALLIAALGRPPFKGAFPVYGTWSEGGETRRGQNGPASRGDPGPDEWKDVFSLALQISGETGPVEPAVQDLGRDLWEVAYALGLLRRHFPSAIFLPLFREAGINPRMISRALDMLAGLGIIDSASEPQIRIPGLLERAEQALGSRKEQVRAVVRNRLLAWERQGKFRPSYRLLEAITALGGAEAPRENPGTEVLILDSIRGDIVNNTWSGIDQAIAKNTFAGVVGEQRAPPLLYIYKTVRALNYEGEEAIREAFREPPPEAEAFPVFRAQIYANLAAYHFGFHNIANAEEMVKEAMLLSQGMSEGRGLSQAYRLFALVSIARQRLPDAIDYLTFAVENCEPSGNLEELAVTAYYAAGSHFLFGNISRAEHFVRRSDEAASAAGRLEWSARARFLQGRLRFEVGRYREARRIFEALSEQDPPQPERDAALAAWIYRCDIFLGEGEARKPPRLNLDGRLFEIEAAWLSGDCALAVKRADELYGALPGSRFIFIEQPDWWSGFAQCEFLLLRPRDLFTRLATSYRALALSRLGRSSDSARGEALESMRRVIREEGLPQSDPNDAFYHYAHYCVLEESGAVEVDMNTAVSMAFKRLQSRASRIDDAETRRAYLAENHWNGALSQAARKHKLI